MAWLVYSHRGVAKRLVLDLEPAGAATADPFTTQPVGHLVDGSGLPSRTAGVTVTASKVTGSGTLGGTLTAVTDDEGIFAFSDLELDTVTTGVTLQFTAGGLVAVTSAAFDVAAGSGTAYALTAEAASYAWSGAAATLRWGRRIAAAAYAYTWTPAAATLRWGRRMTATGTSYTWSPQAATLTYDGVATTLVVTTQPAGAVSGNALTTQPVVRLRNAGGNNVAEAGVTVTAYLSSGSGTLGGTVQVATDASGIATFTDLSITGAGSHTISFHALMSAVQSIWSDDVETNRLSSYYDYDLAGGDFARASVDGTMVWRAIIPANTDQDRELGNLHIGFGRVPGGSYMTSIFAPTVDFGKVTVECDMYHSVNSLAGDQDKFMRLLVIADSNFAEAAKSHCWSNGLTHLALEPTTTVDDDTVLGRFSNDYTMQTYLGPVEGTRVVFGGVSNPATTKRHYKHEMTLNDPGQSNGTNRLYIDDVLDIEGTGYNFVGRWTGYGINAAWWENYRQDGIGKSNERYMDNLTVTGQARALVAASALTVGAGDGTLTAAPASYTWTCSAATLTYSGGVTPMMEEDFSGYVNNAAVQAASWYNPAGGGDWQDTTWSSTDGLSLDTTEGYGTSDRCLKTSFPIGAMDTDGRTINVWLPSSVAEHWTEYWVKISTTFDSDGSGTGNPDYKFIFWALQPSDRRNEIKIGNGGPMDELACVAEGWTDTLYITAANNLNSGVWHRYRVHNKVTGGAGAIFSVEFWDGTNAPILLEQSGSMAPTSMNYFIMGINRNRIADVAMWIKWGKFTLYDSDPGWGF